MDTLVALTYLLTYLLTYCNSALTGVAKVYLQKLQSVQIRTWLLVWCLECAEVNTSPQFLEIYIYLFVSE